MARNSRERVRHVGCDIIAIMAILMAAANVFGQMVPMQQGKSRPASPPRQSKDKAAGSAADTDAAEKVLVSADRDTLKKLADARQFLAEGQFGEAVRKLGAILEGREDFFFQPDKKSSVYRSLKAEVERLIGQMPPEGRELYELQYGARARQMLDEASEAGDVARIAEVSRRFFHTHGGYQATYLLGLHHFEHGRPLLGALVLRRLQQLGQPAEEFEPKLSLTIATCWLQAGVPEKARESLASLRERHPTLRVSAGGRDVPIFTDDVKAIDWLVGLVGPQRVAGVTAADDWVMFRGDAARSEFDRRRCAAVEHALARCGDGRSRCRGHAGATAEDLHGRRASDSDRVSPLGRRQRTVDAYNTELVGGGLCHRQTVVGSSGGQSGQSRA